MTLKLDVHALINAHTMALVVSALKMNLGLCNIGRTAVSLSTISTSSNLLANYHNKEEMEEMDKQRKSQELLAGALKPVIPSSGQKCKVNSRGNQAKK